MKNIPISGGRRLTFTATRTLIIGGALAFSAATPLLAQQSLADRVAAVKNGTAQFEFPARDGVCGDGHSYIRVHESISGTFSSDIDTSNCEPGPVRIVLDVADGRVTSLRDYAGPISLQAGTTELGQVSADEGSKFLLALAENDQGDRVANRAVFPAMLGRDVVAWPALLRIAKASNATRRGSRKHDVVFWLGRYAAAKLAGSDDPYAAREPKDESDEEDVKEHAVFALSQLHDGGGVEPLIEVARTNKDQRVRAKALFWLGESGDPRALDLFEQILTGHAPTPRG
jgi:hypothetical protein